MPEYKRYYLRTARGRHPDKLSRFRTTVKIHKTPDLHNTKQDLRFRPTVACVGTWINCWSKWLDYYLQMLTPFVSTYSSGVQPILVVVKENLLRCSQHRRMYGKTCRRGAASPSRGQWLAPEPTSRVHPILDWLKQSTTSLHGPSCSLLMLMQCTTTLP